MSVDSFRRFCSMSHCPLSQSRNLSETERPKTMVLNPWVTFESLWEPLKTFSAWATITDVT